MARYRVADATQVHHDDRTYAAGEILDAAEREAAEWVARGYVVKVEPKPKKRVTGEG